MRCLRALARDHPVPPFIPEHGVHSAKPVGKANIIAFIESRRKSLKQP